MKMAKGPGTNLALVSTAVTAQNWLERCTLFIRAHGGEGFVIRSAAGGKGAKETHLPATPQQWQAWLAYWRSRAIPHAFAVKHGLATVPCQWPHDFDPSYRESFDDEWSAP